jgi:hypothetical protein
MTIYVGFWTHLWWSKMQEGDISPLLLMCELWLNQRFTIGIIMPISGSDSSALR